MQTARFRWFILISLMIHTVVLCLYGFVPPFKSKLFFPVGVRSVLCSVCTKTGVLWSSGKTTSPCRVNGFTARFNSHHASCTFG